MQKWCTTLLQLCKTNECVGATGYRNVLHKVSNAYVHLSGGGSLKSVFSIAIIAFIGCVSSGPMKA